MGTVGGMGWGTKGEKEKKKEYGDKRHSGLLTIRSPFGFQHQNGS